jgi:transcription antitermination factor NusG
MTSSNVSVQNLHYYAIRTHLQQENRAEANLRAWGVEVFYPKIKEHRRNEFSGAITSWTKPFFSRYLFARFDVDQLLSKVWFTRGVHSVVCCDSIPSIVDDEVIELLKRRVDRDGFVQLGDLKPGDKVVMKRGALDNFVGVFERETNDRDRVVILLDTIAYQGHLIVERDAIRRVAN